MGLKQFNDKTAKTVFIYRRSPAHEFSYIILGADTESGEYVPVGQYTVLDTLEAIDLTEKKLINLVALLNGKRDLLDLGNLTKTRLLFTIVPRSAETDPTKIIFRSHDGKGTSKENAVLTIEKGVLDESSFKQT